MLMIPLTFGVLFFVWFVVTVICTKKASIFINAIIMLFLTILVMGIEGSRNKAEFDYFYLMRTIKIEFQNGNTENLLIAIDSYFQTYEKTENYEDAKITFIEKIKKQ